MIKMHCSIEPRDIMGIYAKGYEFLSFVKNMNNEYSLKLLDSVKKSTIDAIKTS